ncbi:MAG: dTMP kinase [Candidatus Borkfalkiaceae bacterium]|nr:dTMP kinase [Clostridia bacterium]MDY6223928.1 dTMP kinase [Christensenellaceae bacterium]
MAKGKFVTFEGCDGCGKTTQTRMLCAYLDDRGADYVFTREPGGGKISEAIREVILDGKNAEMTDECEALLYAAARVQHLADTVKPALESGKLVLCDRYFDSSFAYQAEGRGLGDKFVASINAYAIEKFTPDVTFLIDLPPEEAFLRKNGADENDRMELAGAEFHRRVYRGFIKQAQKNKKRFVVIDGRQSRETMFASILSALKDRKIID